MSRNSPVLECVDNTEISGLILTPDTHKWKIVKDGRTVIPNSGTIRLPEYCKYKTVLIFVKIKENGDGDELSIDKGNWRDVRKVEGENKGKPFEVTETCNLSLPKYCIGKKYKIYVEKGNECCN